MAIALGLAACALDKQGLGEITDDAGGGGGDAVASSSSSGSSSGTSGSGSGGGDDGGGSGGPSDGSASGSDAVPPFEAGLGCPAAAGWTVVVYESGRGACPAGFGGAHDVYTGAIPGSGACGCTCNITQQPSCSIGQVDTQYASGPGWGPGPCPQGASSLYPNGSGCQGIGAQLAAGFSAEAPMPYGGTCSAMAKGDPSMVTKEGVRFCDVPQAMAADVCAGMVPSGFSACMTQEGDVPCPGAPFTNKTLVADDEMLVCPACGNCTVGGTCQNAQVEFFSDSMCRNSVAKLPVNGACTATNAQNKGVGSYEYTAQPNAQCSATSSGSPSFTPVQPRTVCCR